MATPDTIKTLQEKVAAVLAFDRTTLVKRSEWGVINFEKANRDYARIFDIAGYLKILPVDNLTDQTATQIRDSLERSRATFDQISKFSVETGNPAGTRDSLVGQVLQRADDLFTVASPWIPFLAYQRGDVAKNIEHLNTNVGRAAAMIAEAKETAEKKALEIEQIISKAREASAAAGAAIFTRDFVAQADKLETRAKTWLWITAILAAVTLVTALLFYFFIPTVATQLETFQRIAAKLAVIGILITGTIWCGRVYKALMHQASCYRFKGLGLQTFQAFTAGAADNQTKDAVLLETTRSIFSSYKSGYIDDDGGGDTNIVEVLKSSVPQNGA